MGPLQRGKRSIKNKKSGGYKNGKDAPLQGQRLGEHLSVAERPEPQQVNKIRHRGAAAEDDDSEDCEEEKEAAATPPGMLQRPVDRVGIATLHSHRPRAASFATRNFRGNAYRT